MNAKELAEIYAKAIQNKLSMSCEIDAENRVVLKLPVFGACFFSFEETDPEYLLLRRINCVDQSLTGGDKAQLMELVNRINMMNKGVKLYVEEGVDGKSFVNASVECVVAGPKMAPTQEHIEAIIERIINLLTSGLLRLHELAEENPNSF